MPIQHTDRVQNKTHQTSHTSGWEPRYLTWFMKAFSKRPQLNLRSVAAVAGTYNNGFDNLVINSAALEKHAIDVVTPNGDAAAAASDLQGRTLSAKWNLSLVFLQQPSFQCQLKFHRKLSIDSQEDIISNSLNMLYQF